MATIRELVTKITTKVDDSGVKQASASIDTLNKKLQETDKKLEATGIKLSNTAKKILHLSREYRDMPLEDKLDRFGKNFGLKVGLPITIALGMATKQAVKFEFALANIAKVNPHLSIKKVREEIIELSKYAPGKSLEDLAGAYQVAVQMMNPEEVMPFLKTVEKSSIAFDLMARDTSIALATIKNNLGYTNTEIDDFSDKVSKAHHMFGRAFVQDIISVQSNLSGLTKQMGINQDAVTSWATILLNAGKDASTTSSTIETLARRLSLGEAWEGRKQYINAMKELGINPHDLAKQMTKDPTAGIDNFLVKLKQAADQGKNVTSLAYFLVGANYQSEVQMLSNQLDKVQKLQKTLGDKTKYAGETQRAYNAIMETTEKKLEGMKNSFERAGVSLGVGFLPMMNNVIDSMSWLADKFTELPDWIQKFIGQMLGIVAVVAPIMFVTATILKLRTAIIALGIVTKMNPLLRIGMLAAAGGFMAYDYLSSKAGNKDDDNIGNLDSLDQESSKFLNSGYYTPQATQNSGQMTKINNVHISMGERIFNGMSKGDADMYSRSSEQDMNKLAMMLKYQ